MEPRWQTYSAVESSLWSCPFAEHSLQPYSDNDPHQSPSISCSSTWQESLDGDPAWPWSIVSSSTSFRIHLETPPYQRTQPVTLSNRVAQSVAHLMAKPRHLTQLHGTAGSPAKSKSQPEIRSSCKALPMALWTKSPASSTVWSKITACYPSQPEVVAELSL